MQRNEEEKRKKREFSSKIYLLYPSSVSFHDFILGWLDPFHENYNRTEAMLNMRVSSRMSKSVMSIEPQVSILPLSLSLSLPLPLAKHA